MTDAKAIKLPELDEDKKFRDRKALYFSFLASLAGMFFIYCFLGVYPAGNNSVLVLDLNAQYIYYFEQLRSILTEGKSRVYGYVRVLPLKSVFAPCRAVPEAVNYGSDALYPCAENGMRRTFVFVPAHKKARYGNNSACDVLDNVRSVVVCRGFAA